MANGYSVPDVPWGSGPMVIGDPAINTGYGDFTSTFDSGGSSGGGISNADLAKALQGLGKAQQAGQQQNQGQPLQATAPGSLSAGTPRTQMNLAQLVQILRARQDALLNSATGQSGGAQSMPAARSVGLLGF
jgi:hypothetical protein